MTPIKILYNEKTQMFKMASYSNTFKTFEQKEKDYKSVAIIPSNIARDFISELQKSMPFKGKSLVSIRVTAMILIANWIKTL